MIQPDVRRHASSTSSTNATPKKTSDAIRQRVAVPDVVAAREQVGDRRDAERGAHDVPPHQPVAVARGDREQQEHEQQHEADVHRAQDLRGHDLDRRVEMEQRHDDEQRRRRACRASRGSGWWRPPPASMNAAAFCSRASSIGRLDAGFRPRSPSCTPGSARRSPAVRLLRTLTPCSSKYFFAPGWIRHRRARCVWFLSSMFCASLCTATSSGFFSNSVLTMS